MIPFGVMNKASQKRLHKEVRKEEQVLQAETTEAKCTKAEKCTACLREIGQRGRRYVSSAKYKSEEPGINPVGSRET